MSRRHVAPAFRRLRKLIAAPDAEASDALLLRRFITQRDESAFELLVWRHGRMVYGLCRRVLGDDHDAEDAFQATLLVLARKAASIGKHESVGSWLYKVAYRVALRARDGALRRARHERQVPEMPPVGDPHPPADPGWAELRPVLDEELSRLSEKYRAPVVLCYLEGLTHEEAARQLACPVGTVKTRLAQARRLLGAQLTRRGLALAAGVVAIGTLPAEAAPPALVTATVRAAVVAVAGKVLGDSVSAPVAHLTEGVLRAMMVTKLKGAAVVLVLGLAVAGVGGASLSALAGDVPPEEKAKPQTGPAEVRVNQLKTKIADLNRQLRKAEEDAEKEKDAARKKEAAPPRDKPIAVIFGDVPITREELAEHLIARMSARQLERYLNLRILEHEAKAKGIWVSDSEVDTHVKEEMKRLGYSEKAFREQVLGKQGMTMQEWKSDVARPQLLLKKLACKSQITDAEVRAAYEARYGDRIECRAIVMRSEEDARRAARRIRKGDSTFEKEAERWRPGTGATTIKIPQCAPNTEAWIKAACAMKTGEVSEVIKYLDSFLILECSRRIPADTTVRFEDVRASLRAELGRRVRDDSASESFKDLKAKARPKLLWTPPKDDER
jgi:RNA polymerase sigma factor (sigma-70 family)